MLKMFFTGCLLFGMTALPAMVMCQDGPVGKWWRNPDLSKQLSLTDDEIKRLDEQYVESRRKLIDLKSNVERERFELETILESKEMNEEAAKKQFDNLEKARRDLSNERFNLLIKSRKILGNERFQDVKRMYKRKKHNRRRK